MNVRVGGWSLRAYEDCEWVVERSNNISEQKKPFKNKKQKENILKKKKKK